MLCPKIVPSSTRTPKLGHQACQMTSLGSKNVLCCAPECPKIVPGSDRVPKLSHQACQIRSGYPRCQDPLATTPIICNPAAMSNDRGPAAEGVPHKITKICTRKKKARAHNSKNANTSTTARGGHLTILRPSVDATPLSHAHTASCRSLARTTQTRNGTETYFPNASLLCRLFHVNLRDVLTHACCLLRCRHLVYKSGQACPEATDGSEWPRKHGLEQKNA